MTGLVVKPVIERLKDPAGGGLAALGLRDVQGAGDLVAAADQIADARAFVVWTGDQAAPNDAGSAVLHQLISTRFAVVVGFANTGPTAANWSDAWDTMRRALQLRLCGWVHPLSADAPDSPVEFVSAGLVRADFDKRTMLVQAVFSFDHFLRILP
jgi:hypothetical protein